MRTMRDYIRAVGLALSGVYTVTEFVTDAYTRAVTFVIDETITSGTAGSGAWAADSPWSAVSLVEVLINGQVRWSLPGYWFAHLMGQDQRYAAWYSRTTWAISTALVHDAVFRVNFCPGPNDPPLPPGTVIQLRLTIGTIAQRVSTVTPTYTSGTAYVYQEIDTQMTAAEQARAKNFPFIRELGTTTISDLTTAHTNFHDQSLPSGGLIRQLMMRVISNSALADSIVNTAQVEYEGVVLTKELSEQMLKADYVRKTGLTAATGYLLLSGDIDGDERGFFETYPGKRLQLRIKNGAATTNGSMETLIDRWVPKS